MPASTLEYDIAVILINYNSSTFTIDAVNSILEKTSSKIRYQIIVVDNNSTLRDFQSLKKGLSESDVSALQLIRNTLNTGFGSGNNRGVEAASAEYYAFVNNDTVLLNDCLSILFDFMEGHPTAAASCPQSFDENENVLKSFDHFLSLKRELFGRKTLESLNPKRYPARRKIYANPIQVDCIPGSFLFVKADRFHKAGGFDPNIFLYFEESDLCYRLLKKTGGGSYLVPAGKYIHFRGKSTKQLSAALKEEMLISRLYVIRKNSGFVAFTVLRWWLSIKYLIKSVFKPARFSMFKLAAKGGPLAHSLKHQQTKSPE